MFGNCKRKLTLPNLFSNLHKILNKKCRTQRQKRAGHMEKEINKYIKYNIRLLPVKKKFNNIKKCKKSKTYDKQVSLA